MIKIDTIEDKDGFRLECKVEGMKSTIAQELAALDMYLDMRGFKVEE